MARSNTPRRTAGLALLALTLLVFLPARTAGQDDQQKPSLALRARPTIAFTPARVVVTAEVRDGADDYRDFYCPTLEWDWGDGTRSESASDCDPYEAGKSEIRRRYIAEHTYRQPGSYRVRLNLKQGGSVTASATAPVQIRPGLGPDPLAVRHY